MSQHKEAYVISYHGALCHDYRGIPIVSSVHAVSHCLFYDYTHALCINVESGDHTVSTVQFKFV